MKQLLLLSPRKSSFSQWYCHSSPRSPVLISIPLSVDRRTLALFPALSVYFHTLVLFPSLSVYLHSSVDRKTLENVSLCLSTFTRLLVDRLSPSFPLSVYHHSSVDRKTLALFLSSVDRKHSRPISLSVYHHSSVW